MTRRSICAAVLLLLVLAPLAGAGWRYHHTRPACPAGIPDRNYQFGRRSAPVFALSAAAIPVMPDIAPAARGPRILLYQLNDVLSIDHCSVSRFALHIHETGEWTVSLRADQNPVAEADRPVAEIVTEEMVITDPDRTVIISETAARNGKSFHLHMARNQFHIRIRGYAAMPLAEGVPAATPGEPVMFELAPAPFWVQRGIPYHHRITGRSDDICRSFGYVQRVEVEFYYQ